jgi:8-oxo-dGTP pyrophosphatase MutT (NUDIX family)
MSSLPTEDFIIRQLQTAYQPGKVASIDVDPGMVAPESLKCAAVLIPLVWQADEWHLVFTRRTDTVEHHKGQVSFPGGGCEMGESTPEATALREAWEEIGLNPESVRLLGRMNAVITITRFLVTPVVGIIPWPYQVLLEPSEVVRLFTIPLLWLSDRANWTEQSHAVAGLIGPIPVIRYNPYDGEILWGITARIMQNFLSVLGL